MDRFKFRVWDKEKNVWISFFRFLSKYSATSFDSNDSQKITSIFHERFVIHQCTGLKDKNGELIFEGDWINVLIWFGELTTSSIKECKFKDGKFGYELDDQMMDLWDGEAEIIGNIFEGVLNDK